MSQKTMPMVSRTGNDNQRYGSKGERLVAGVVPFSADKTKILLIQSSSRKGWVLPKGGWEKDEKSPAVAAAREAWEEAGIIIRVDKDLEQILDTRPTSAVSKNAPKASYHFFQVTVIEERGDWPEKAKRQRRWFTIDQAKSELAQRPELSEALRRSLVKR